MTEKIYGSGFRPADAAGARRTEAAKPAAAGSSVTKRDGGAGETVQLTASARLLGKLEEAIRAVPVVDAERVAALRDAIDSGSYEVDAHAVAERMLRLERELGR